MVRVMVSCQSGVKFLPGTQASLPVGTKFDCFPFPSMTFLGGNSNSLGALCFNRLLAKKKDTNISLKYLYDCQDHQMPERELGAGNGCRYRDLAPARNLPLPLPPLGRNDTGKPPLSCLSSVLLPETLAEE